MLHVNWKVEKSFVGSGTDTRSMYFNDNFKNKKWTPHVIHKKVTKWLSRNCKNKADRAAGGKKKLDNLLQQVGVH